jgi:hypothetical protein
MFSPLIKLLGNDIVFLVDDMEYSEKERDGNSGNIISILESLGMEFLLISKVLKGENFPIVISTGLSFLEKVTFKSFCKFIYAITIGGVFEATGISDLLERRTGKRLSAGGYKAVIFQKIQPERELGQYTVRYPKGLDISKKYYPEQRWAGVFDLHLCHGNIDKQLVENKFPGVSCLKIGYPKYNVSLNIAESREEIMDEFGLTNNKPLILWMPTHFKNPEETAQNISSWIPKLHQLQGEFVVFARIHPKTHITRPDIAKKLEAEGFIVDLKRDRNLSVLYTAANLVIADYGASVLSTVYMNKNLLLLELNPFPASVQSILGAGYLDIESRKYIPSVDNANQVSTYFYKLDRENEPNTLSLKERFFGDDSEIEPIRNIAALLLEKLTENCGDLAN